jgi:hypothetical protein
MIALDRTQNQKIHRRKIETVIYEGQAETCTHVLTLVSAMAPAAFQGAWSARIRQPLDRGIYAAMMSRLKNTCWAWRADGLLA